MKSAQAATLTSTLLFPKGGAAAFGPRRSEIALDGDRAGGGSGMRSRPSTSNPWPRVSFKLDRPTHQQLKLAAARLGLSTREMLAAAVGHYLTSVVPSRISGACCCLKRPTGLDATQSRDGASCDQEGCLAKAGTPE